MTDQVATAQVDKKPFVSQTEDLDKKLLHIPGVCDYHIVMRQRGETRFFCIMEVKEVGRRNRVVVPMSYCEEFTAKLYDVLKFGDDNKPKSLPGSKPPEGPQRYVHSVSIHTTHGRRYYFDIIDADALLSLKLSYAFDRRRDSIVIDLGSLVAFVGVIQVYQDKYPTINEKDDYPTYAGSRYDNRRPSPRRGSSYGRGFYSRDSSQSSRGRQTFASRPKTEENSERRRPQSLKVCSDPAPCQFTSNIKKFTFEIVEGVNTFMRITEIIGENRRSTIHVPIDCLKQLQEVVEQMGDRFAEASSSNPPAVGSTT